LQISQPKIAQPIEVLQPSRIEELIEEKPKEIKGKLTKTFIILSPISYTKMKVCMCVCVCMSKAARPTQAITPKFGVGSSFHLGSAPSQGATQNVGPQGYLPY
jgi:hypothetical protein